MPPKRATPTHLILPHTTLRFVHRHARVLTQRSRVIRQRKPLFVKTVSRFMDRAEERIQRIVFLEPRRHPHISPRSLAKRMRRHIDAATTVIKAKFRRYFLQKTALSIHRKPMQWAHCFVRRRGRLDFLHQRYESHFEFGKQLIDHLCRESRIMQINRVVVRAIAPTLVFSFAFC